MRKIIIFSILALFIFDTLGKENWITDFKHAQKIAAEEEKYILIDFSGSDWCGWCVKLDQEVFQTKIWKEYSDKYLVQVLIDFPSDKTGQSDSTQKQNRELAKKYDVRGYPTIILLNSNGEFIDRTGYQRGGPKNYINHIKELTQKPIVKD